MNKVILVGRFARDPELRTTGSGKSVATFSLAVDRRYQAEGQPTADFLTLWPGANRQRPSASTLAKADKLL